MYIYIYEWFVKWEVLLLTFAMAGNIDGTFVSSLIKSTDETCRTVLHWAASGGRTSVVQWLIEHQAEIDAKDDTR